MFNCEVCGKKGSTMDAFIFDMPENDGRHYFCSLKCVKTFINKLVGVKEKK